VSKLPIRIYPDPVLRQPAVEVTVFDAQLKKYLADLLETMYAANGVGLASPQVGISKRAVVIDVSNEGNAPLILVNPRIIAGSGSVSSEEGCLSIPGYRDTIKRKAEISVEAQDELGSPVSFKADGLLAICVQHELDHLDGVLFVDRLSRLKREFFKKWLKRNESGDESEDE
jgi:peptide deformylase